MPVLFSSHGDRLHCGLIRLVALLYELLGAEADALVCWPSGPPSGVEEPAYVEPGPALERLLSKQDWQGASR